MDLGAGVRMHDTWQIVKWIWMGVCFIWLGVQWLAWRRLKGDLRRRSVNVLWVVLVLYLVWDWIRTVFENPEAVRIGMVVVGAAAIVATVLLVRMLLSPDRGKMTDTQDDAAEAIQSLKLN